MTPNIIPSIFTAVDKFSATVGKMGANMTAFAGISVAQSARMERSFAMVSAGALGLASSAGAIAAGIVIPLGLATKTAVNFEQQMGNVGTLINTTTESLGQIGDGVLELSKKIAKPISDLETGMYQIRSAGIDAGNGINEAFGVLESSGKLAIAGLSTTTEAVNAETSAMNVFKNEGLSSEQVANSFFKTVQLGKTTMAQLSGSFGANAAILHEAGVSLLEMNAATAALTVTGISASQAQVELAQSVTALIKPSTNLLTVYEALGYSGEDAFKQIVASAGGLVPAMQKINEQARKMGVTMGEDFGNKRALIANIELTGNLNDTYKKYLAIQRDGQDTLGGKFAEQNTKAAAQMRIFRNSVERMGISVGNLLIPALNKFMGLLTPIIEGVTDFAKNHKTLAGIIVDSVGAFGLLAGSVGAVSLAVYMATKAFALWKAAAVGLGIVMKAGAAVIEIWDIATYAAASGMGVMTTAATLLEMAIAPIALPLLAAGVAIAYFGFKSHYANREAELMAHSVKMANGTFKEIRVPINQAAVALEEYNKAYKEYLDKQDAYQRKKYTDAKMKEQHPVEYALHQLISYRPATTIGGKLYRGSEADTIAAPVMKDFGDTTGANTAPKNDTLANPQGYGMIYGHGMPGDTNHNVEITLVDKTIGGVGYSSKSKSGNINRAGGVNIKTVDTRSA